MTNASSQSQKKFPVRQAALAVTGLALFAGLFFLAYSLVTTWCVSKLPGVAVNGCSASTDPQGQATPQDGTSNVSGLPTPEPVAPEADLPPTWDGASRVTILIMGLDADDTSASTDRSGPPKTDSMILLTIDPQTKTAGMLSIPRDLWVNIPGFGYGRINMAYMYGEGSKLPGGGPALAMKTVEQVIGVPVQYYAQIEFWAFTKLIDDLDKINVFVDKKITIDPRGPGEDKIMLSAGYHWLGGVEALAFARQRHTQGGDVDRANRQQQVLLAIRDRVLDPANFSTLVANAPKIYGDIQAGVNTNLTFDQIMRLAMLAKDVPLDSIKRGVIDYTMVTLQNVTLDGQPASVFKPMPDKIRELRDGIFSSSGIVSPLAKGADALDLAKQENPTIAVYNGSYTQGLAGRTADYLKSLGFNVIATDNAKNLPGATVVIDHSGNPYTLKYFKDVFHLNGAIQVQSDYNLSAPAQIEIIVADDWANSNPMP